MKQLDSALAREDLCPRCLGELDEGWECNECGYDAILDANKEVVFTHCNGCGRQLKEREEYDMGLCLICAWQ